MKGLKYIILLCFCPFLGKTQALYIQSGATVHVTRDVSVPTTPQLFVEGAIQNLGTLAVAGNIAGSQNFTNNGTFKAYIGGTTYGTGYNRIVNNGIVTLTGSTLEVVFVNSYTPALGASFIVIDGTSLVGTFTNSLLPVLAIGLKWVIAYDNAQGTVTLSVANAVLPVELQDFTATLVPQSAKSASATVQLDWSTVLEQNTKDFILERSQNAQFFTPLSKTVAKGSNSVYQYVDEKPEKGINYYRLAITDWDGKISYSKIVSIKIAGSKTFKVYPNPVSNTLTVETDSVGDFQIINLLGQVVLTGKIPQPIDVSILPAGTYLIKSGTQQAKFVKQ